MANAVNRRIVLNERPRYTIPTANIFKLDSGPVPQPGADEVLVRTLWLGMDPYLYSRVKRTTSEAEPVPLGNTMVGATVGRVEISNRADFKPGDLVSGFWGWQDYAVSDGSRITRIESDIAHPSHMLGAFGISGFAAYVAVNEIMHVKPGETLTFGAALGGLGQMVGQIGKIKGARVVGVAGGKEKCRIAVEQLGFDACIDHKSKEFSETLSAEYRKSGVDAYVMAIGGKMFEVALPYFKQRGRVTVCGLMATYGMTSLPPGPDRTMLLFNQMLIKRMRIEGLVILDYMNTPVHENFKRDMKTWIREGKVKPVEHIVEGLEKAPDALQGLFAGKNQGKCVVRVAD